VLLALCFHVSSSAQDAEFYTAKSYLKERDFEKAYINFQEFIKHTEFTKDQDHKLLGEAYYNIGHFYKCGHYLKCDIDSAIHYLEISSLAYKYVKGARMLRSIFYFSGYGKVDKERSLNMLKFAADLGDIKSNLELGEIYLSGRTKILVDSVVGSSHSYRHVLVRSQLITDYTSAVIDSVFGYYYYERGKDINHPLINEDYMLKDVDFAESYMYGTHSEVDYDIAYSYLSSYASLQKDIDNDNDSAIVRSDPEMAKAYWLLQTVYRYGLGTRTNIQKADMFLRLAAKYGSQKAIKALELLGTE
jgi:TPR repeat protein